MSDDHQFTRRELLAMSAALGGVMLAAPLGRLVAQTDVGRVPTPDQAMGPFYPVTKPVDRDADLTVIQGKPGKAKGQVLYVIGRVFNLKGEPLRNVSVEIWQANTFGRYSHPVDKNTAPLDPNFQGSGVLKTDAEGRYRFKTIKPGAYPVNPDWTRPPHIHFDVTGKSSRLVTQMYFAGEPLNETDLLFRNTLNKEILVAKLMPPPRARDVEPDALIAVWDIVLFQT